jgi:Spy/CpxP family protein refolding chaperone
MRRIPTLTAAALLLATAASAQHMPGGHHGRPDAAAQPYAGFQDRPIKALSAEQVADLRAGRGMALALPAELNGYPGPMHALEHAAALRLTAAQSARLAELMTAMRRDAVAAGERVIAAEAALDRLFAERRATPEAVATATAEVGAAGAALRAIHLVTHIATREVLTAEQVLQYDVLRGYRPGR